MVEGSGCRLKLTKLTESRTLQMVTLNMKRLTKLESQNAFVKARLMAEPEELRNCTRQMKTF